MKSKAEVVKRVKKAVKAGKVVFPEHAIMPARKPKGPLEFTHVSVIGFKGMGSDQGGFILQWGTKEHGFGEFTFVQKSDGTIECDSEAMGRATVKMALDKFFEKAKVR